MKNYKALRLQIIILIIISGSAMELYAQSTPYSMAAMSQAVRGYVILSNGDTLNGKIKWSMKYVENNPVEIKFTAENGASKVFEASEVKGIGLLMEDIQNVSGLPPEHYVSVPSIKKGVPVFMRRLIDGKMTVYQNRSAAVIGGYDVDTKTQYTGLGFSFSSDGLTIGPTYHTDYKIIADRSRYSSYYVVKDSAAMIKVEKDNYDSLFSTLYGNCQALDQELAKNPDLKKFKNFMIISEIYNELCK
jgi:hypothetical protein